ncbi:hypothetical protein B0H16DRAFT_1665830 [Mycena metata]|uniref:Uncharacterized protein n=1 Tax=Mycena metata TaxID=1033252 RepID=A0AAD7HRM1_9AGAR|nr:hypothetical protein B0H16DRAFT_1665830 [Mycena metata]
MPPGPSEQTSEQLQHYLKLTVDNLLLLYNDGITIAPPEHPNEFPARNGDEHRRLCYQYRDLSTGEEREEFFSKYGVRWTEFARLIYFDIVRFTVVDPMHNLLLGLAKTQWYNQWIQTNTLRADTPRKNRELHLIHDFLESFEAPLWAGRLPLRVGEPAGGSLTADEYKFAVTGPWAMIIPMVWDKFAADAAKSHTAALAKYTKAKSDWDREVLRAKRRNQEVETEEPELPKLRMMEGEDENFLAFATALKIMVGSALYGANQMKPNHHWSVHVPDQIIDYGPLYSIWAFLTERLNKILKNLNSNNWTGGRLEVSMMREFHRSAGLDGVMGKLLSDPLCTPFERQFIQSLGREGENREALGTIQDAVRDGMSQYPKADGV